MSNELDKIEVLIIRYSSFEINETIIRRICEEIFSKIPLSLTSNSLTYNLFLTDKVTFKRGIVILREEILDKIRENKKGINIERSNNIYIKLETLIVKVLQSKIFENI